MSSQKGRQVWLNVFRNFLKSFQNYKAEQLGKYVGSDSYGNKYFENEADPSRGKRKSRRSFVPAKHMHFDIDNKPIEWESWLRHSRKEPPTIEELEANLAMAKMKQANAARIDNEKKRNTESLVPEGVDEEKHASMSKFPQYDDLEVNPGKDTMKYK